jgi:hypothetical protein
MIPDLQRLDPGQALPLALDHDDVAGLHAEPVHVQHADADDPPFHVLQMGLHHAQARAGDRPRRVGDGQVHGKGHGGLAEWAERGEADLPGGRT